MADRSLSLWHDTLPDSDDLTPRAPLSGDQPPKTTLDIAHRTEAPDTDLDALVRRVDPDRWLASRFIADPKARTDVIALYAFNYELARVAGGVSNALMGDQSSAGRRM